MSSMRKLALAALLAVPLGGQALADQPLSVQWEELTAGDFVKAIHQAKGTCILPFGILEKHGQQLPLGTDLISARYVSLAAARQEPAVVFPAYYFGQIAEARQQPGTIAYSRALQLELLQETTDEMSRNGCKKIVIVNGHGGNEYLLPYFAQTQLQSPHDYVLYVFGLPEHDLPGRPKVVAPGGLHASEEETSRTLIADPDAVKLDRANEESGADQHRLHLPDSLYTGIYWYASYPNHYAGNAAAANKELGKFDMENWTGQIVTALKAVKADDVSLKLQNEYYEKSTHPMDVQPYKK